MGFITKCFFSFFFHNFIQCLSNFLSLYLSKMINTDFQYYIHSFFFQLSMVVIVVTSIMFLRIVVTITAYAWAKKTNNDVIQSQVHKYSIDILFPKLFWPTVRKNCSSDREKLLKFEAEGWEFAIFWGQFIGTLKGHCNVWNRMLFQLVHGGF